MSWNKTILVFGVISGYSWGGRNGEVKTVLKEY